MVNQTKLEGKLIFGPLFNESADVLFLFAPLVVAFALVWFAQSCCHSALMFTLAAQGFGLAHFHQSATWWHFFDSNNRSFYFTPRNILWALLLPAAFIPLSVAGFMYFPALLMVVYLVWTIQHLLSQNIGLFLLYIRNNQNCANGDAATGIRAMHSAAAACGFWFLLGQVETNQLLVKIVGSLSLILAVETVFCVVKFARSIDAERRSGRVVNVPYVLFWILSVLYFVPLVVYGKAWQLGLLIPVTLHWFQYIGLNLLLVKRKYAMGSSFWLGESLAGTNDSSRFYYRTFAICSFVFVAVSLVLAYVTQLTDAHPSVALACNSVLTALIFVHYTHDAFIWRFRESFNRASILPYVLRSDAAPTPVLTTELTLTSTR